MTAPHHANPSGATAPPSGQTSNGWSGVWALALGAFIFNTTEFAPVGLLENIAAGFGMSAAQVGVMLTVYAWVVAVASLPLMLLTAQMERKRLLLAVFGVFVAAHVASLFATSFALLLASRVGIALAHAIFWSITAALAVRLTPAGGQSRALALIGAGSTLAMVLGVPLGRVVGDGLGWRMTFGLIAALALLVALALARTLPALPSRNAGSAASVPLLLQRSALRWVYVLLLLVVTAQFTLYSYVEPLVQTLAALPPQVTTGALVASGIAGLAGSVLFGCLGLRRPALFLIAAVATLAACLALFVPVAQAAAAGWGWLAVPSSWPFAVNTPSASGWPVAFYAVCFIWGAAMLCIALSIQARVLALASDATDVGTSLFSGIFNVGIGAGALAGSLIIAQAGLAPLAWAGALLAAGALAAFVGATRGR